MRKIAVILTLILLAGVLHVFAQDGTGVQIIGSDIFTRAGQAYDAQNYQQAVTDFSLYILLNPTDSQAYFNRGLSYLQLNDANSSLADLNHALSLPAASPELTARTYALRSLIYIQLKQIDSAMNDLDAGINADPTMASLYLQRGQLFASQNDMENALTDLNQYVKLSPNTTDGYDLRARVNMQLQNYDDAVADYTQLITLTPNDPSLLAARANAYLLQEKYEPALADLTAAIQIAPSAGQLYLLRGKANNQLGNQTDAASDYLEWERSQKTDVASNLLLRPGESQTVQMKTGQIYTMGFEGKTGQKVTINASARPGETTDPLLILFDPTGQPLVADDDGGGNFDAAITAYTLPADGIYGVSVGHAGGGTNGPVRVLLQIAP